jgi:hypothetical protein
MTRRHALVAAGAVAGVALVAVAAVAVARTLAPRETAPQLPPPQDGIVLTARTATQSAFFGDPVEASALATIDTRKVDPASVHLRGSFAPFSVASSSLVRRQAGPILLLRAAWTLTCLEATCLPGKTSHDFGWAPLELDYRLRGTSLQRALTQPFEPVTVLTRLAPDAAAHPRFRVPPPVLERPHYRIRPGLLAVLLAVAGIALCALAVGLAAYAIVGLRRRRTPPPDPFALVLAELHGAARGNGDSARRRRALERLAEMVEPHDEELSGAATALAWAPDDPPADAMDELARRARESQS